MPKYLISEIVESHQRYSDPISGFCDYSFTGKNLVMFAYRCGLRKPKKNYSGSSRNDNENYMII